MTEDTEHAAPRLRVVASDGIATLTLSRPARLNAINFALLTELRRALLDVGERDDIRAVVLAGAGRAFCAGLDLTEGLADPALDDPVAAMHAGMEAGAAVTLALRAIPQPVIAAVQGHAVGAGFALAAAADVRFVAPDVRFSAPFVKLGMSVGDFGLSWLLPRIIGQGRAAHLFLSAGALDADDAFDYGLASAIAPDPLAAATAFAATLAALPAYGVRTSKRLMEAALSSTLRDHAGAEAQAQALGALTADARLALAGALDRATQGRA